MRYETTASRLKLFQTKCDKVRHSAVKKSFLFICAALLFTVPDQASASLEVLGGNATTTADGSNESTSLGNGIFDSVTVKGGNGGWSNKGGDATLNINSLNVNTTVSFIGGNGAGGYNGVNNSTAGGNGGQGVSCLPSSTIPCTTSGSMSGGVQNGSIGSYGTVGSNGGTGAAGGHGGTVSINADSITAKDIVVRGGNGGNGGAGSNGNNGGTGGAGSNNTNMKDPGNSVVYPGGNGGNGGRGGWGGNGGAGASVDITVNTIKADTFSVTSGTGGTGGYGGNGGNGGNGGEGGNSVVVCKANGICGYGGTGGSGGAGGAGGKGGAGGDVTIHAQSIDVNYLSIGTGSNGGSYGNGASGSQNGSKGSGDWGGNGGIAGAGGTGGTGGTTGNIYFSADTLKAQDIYIRKYGGELNFNVGTFYVQPDTELYAYGTSVSDINIKNLYFDISDAVNNSLMLNIRGSGQIDISNSSITLDTKGGSGLLEQGSKITLINDAYYYGRAYSSINSTTVKRGAIFLYDFNITTDGNKVTATLEGIRHNPDAKALSESHLGGVALLNSADELLSDENLQSSAFAVTGYGQSKYKTGSSVDTKGFSLLAGVSKSIRDSGYIGLYFQGGSGSYDVNGESDGSGDVKYYGVGLFSKLELGESVYADIGIKAGKVKNDFTLDDKSADIKLDDLYYGIQLGGGYKIRLFDASLLDLSTKYFYTHEDGDDVTVQGDKIKFDDIDSHRIKVGAKLSFNELEQRGFNPFVALAYEHEFGGDSKASTEYYDIDAPSLKGGTGSGELGVEIKPSKSFYIGLGLKGFTGQRQGANLKAEAEYKF